MPGSRDPVDEARQALRHGQLVVYPTDTLYGLGCLADERDAVRDLLELTDRPPDIGLSVLFPDLERAETWAKWTPTAQALTDAFMPGPITLILDATRRAPQPVLSDENTVGIRHIDHETALALAREGPIVSTSANPHGDPPARTVDDAREAFGDKVKVYVDEGTLDGPASTVVDARGDRPTVIREGPIGEDEIREATDRGR